VNSPSEQLFAVAFVSNVVLQTVRFDGFSCAAFIGTEDVSLFALGVAVNCHVSVFGEL
jgi:hypothetical protein